MVDDSGLVLRSRGALGISTAERVFEIPASLLGLEQRGNATSCFPDIAKQSQCPGSTGIGPVALMRSIIMNAVLTVGYDRYVLNIEDAAKVMKILSEAYHVTYQWGRDEDDGSTSADRYVVNQRKTLLELAPLNVPLTDA